MKYIALYVLVGVLFTTWAARDGAFHNDSGKKVEEGAGAFALATLFVWPIFVVMFVATAVGDGFRKTVDWLYEPTRAAKEAAEDES